MLEAKLLPVMVFIHGGGFITGYAHAYGEQYLMDQDIVLVSMNYRLGIFGKYIPDFLSSSFNAKSLHFVVAAHYLWFASILLGYGVKLQSGHCSAVLCLVVHENNDCNCCYCSSSAGHSVLIFMSTDYTVTLIFQVMGYVNTVHGAGSVLF